MLFRSVEGSMNALTGSTVASQAVGLGNSMLTQNKLAQRFEAAKKNMVDQMAATPAGKDGKPGEASPMGSEFIDRIGKTVKSSAETLLGGTERK